MTERSKTKTSPFSLIPRTKAYNHENCVIRKHFVLYISDISKHHISYQWHLKQNV